MHIDVQLLREDVRIDLEDGLSSGAPNGILTIPLGCDRTACYSGRVY